MTNTATRLITLIMLLQRQPNQKAADLASALGVSIRTLHRYVGMLDELGIPVYSERGPQGGFSLVRGYKMPPLVFTPAEAVAVVLGTGLVGNLWGDLYTEAAQSALAKLANVLPEAQQEEVAWAQKALVTPPLPHAGLDSFAMHLRPLRAAIRAQKRVRMLYQSSNSSAPLARDVDPYALAHNKGWWYFIGYCHLREGIRLFRIDRVQGLETLDIGFTVADDFDARQFLNAEIKAETPILVRMQMFPEFAYLALNRPVMWKSMDIQPDGSVIVTTLMPDMIAACAFMMSFGPAAVVLEPEALRAMVLDWAQGLVSMYDPPDG